MVRDEAAPWFSYRAGNLVPFRVPAGESHILESRSDERKALVSILVREHIDGIEEIDGWIVIPSVFGRVQSLDDCDCGRSAAW